MAHYPASAAQFDELPTKRAKRPIDLVHLAGQCLGDEHLEYEILRLFEATVKIYFERLEAAVSHEDVALSLHSIKGAASGVGAWTIADLAKMAESEIAPGRPLTSERVADLAVAIEEVREFIARMLSNEPD